MNLDRKQLKRTAREKLRSTDAGPSPLRVTLLFLLLGSGISLAVDFIVANPAVMLLRLVEMVLQGREYMQIAETIGGGTQTILALFLHVLIILYTSVLSYGYYAYTLRRTDGKETAYGDLLCGFSSVGRVITMQLLIGWFTLVWAMAVMMPLTMLGTFLLLMALTVSESLAYAGVVLLYVLCLGGMLLVQYLTLRYAFAPFLMAEFPEMAGLEAIRGSRLFLRGHTWELFKLTLSFLGWRVVLALVPVLLGGLAGGALMAAGFAAGETGIMLLGAYVFVLLGFFVQLPLNMWIIPYYHGALAEYYRAKVHYVLPVAGQE
ncbi:MAG: DUF975 family protein, partial [Pseudoflavonifractor sp.]